ncbi:MAG: cupin domain-containing protein [Mycobacteriales bacterium]
MTTKTNGSVVRNADQAERRWFAGGGEHLWMARAEETHGAFHAFVNRLVRGKMTPLHMHPDADDSLYVIDGEILYQSDGEQRVITAGGFASSLRGTPHAFMVTSETATLFCFQTPGAGEAFYLEASDLVGDGGEPTGSVDIPRLQEAAARNPAAVQFLGPPPFAPPTA